MLIYGLTALLCCAPQGGGEVDPATLSPADFVIKEIKEALKGKESHKAVNVVLEHRDRSEKKIIGAIAAGFRHKEPDVRTATVRALRYNESDVAFAELMKLRRRKKWNG